MTQQPIHRAPSTHSDIELSPLPRSTTPAESLKQTKEEEEEEEVLSSTIPGDQLSLPSPSSSSRISFTPSEEEPPEGAAVALAPTDGGRAAYTFLLGAFLIEALV